MVAIKSPTRYCHIPKNGRSLGAVEFVFPIAFLMNQFVVRFLLSALKNVQQGTPIPNESEFLQEHGIDQATLQFTRLAQSVRPPRLSWDGSLAGLRRVLHVSVDLTDGNGEWRDDVSLDEEAREFEILFLRKASLAVQVTHAKFGLQAAIKLVLYLVRQLRETRDRIHNAGDSNPRSLISDVDIAAARVQSVLRRPGWRVNVPTRFFSQRSLRFVFSAGQQRIIQKLTKAGVTLQEARSSTLARQASLTVLDRLLGSPSATGQLNEILFSLEEHSAQFSAVVRTVEELEQVGCAQTATRVPIVDGLDTVLADDTGVTVLDEFLQRAEQSGCTPIALARNFREDGLSNLKESLLPHEWSTLKPAIIVKSLLAITERYLGCDDSDAELDILDPRSAAERIARLHLLHKSVRPRLLDALAVANQSSSPYAEFERLKGVTENIQTFLYCYPTQREQYIDLLQRQLRPIAEASRAKEYATSHPYSMLLLQYRIAAPIGAMRAFHRWAIHGCHAEKHGQVKPIEPRQPGCEVRLLAERIRCLEDCRSLLSAANEAGLVTTVGATEKLALAHDDRRLVALFAPPSWETTSVPASKIHELLREDGDFAAFLTQQFSNDGDLRVLLARLRREHKPQVVVDALLERNVLSQVANRFTVNAQFATNPRWAPRELVNQIPGPLVGLDREQFLTQMYENDLLYTILFFGVMDARELGWISANVTPPSVTEYAGTLI